MALRTVDRRDREIFMMDSGGTKPTLDSAKSGSVLFESNGATSKVWLWDGVAWVDLTAITPGNAGAVAIMAIGTP